MTMPRAHEQVPHFVVNLTTSPHGLDWEYVGTLPTDGEVQRSPPVDRNPLCPLCFFLAWWNGGAMHIVTHVDHTVPGNEQGTPRWPAP